KIRPVFECDVPTICATRQAAGDVEYLFAVNATPANTKDRLALKETPATVVLPADGRPVYDAVRGGLVPEFSSDRQPEPGRLTGRFRFGPGQMRVFARTARPIARVRVAQPIVRRELVNETEPIRLEIAASVVGTGHRLLSGSIPLHIRV